MAEGQGLSDYSEQTAAGVPLTELVDWNKVPKVITPKTKSKGGRPTKLQKRAKPTGWFPEETKIEAVALYAALGSCAEVARHMNVSAATLRTWKATEWWELMMRRVHSEQDEKLDSKFTKVVDLAMEEINDRLVNGEYVYNPKTGQTVRVKPKMRDVNQVVITNLDKRQLLRGMPTTRSEKVDASDSLKRLAEEFSKFARAKEVIQSTCTDIEIEGA